MRCGSALPAIPWSARTTSAHGALEAFVGPGERLNWTQIAEGARRTAAALHAAIDLHVQFMQPAEGTLIATGSVESSTRALVFCRGLVHDETGILVASAVATMRLRRTAST